MLHSRIREIRKQKGLTLQEVAERAGTTAQTIGRLETGMRTVSIKWLNRIADALEVEPSMLLTVPERGETEVGCLVEKDGRVVVKPSGIISMSLYATAPTALKFRVNSGEYRAGDIVVCEGHGAGDLAAAIGRDCLVETKQGQRLFAKVMYGSKKGVFSLLMPGQAGAPLENQQIVFAAPVVALIRRFS